MLAMPPEAWYEMYVKPWHPELARVGMCVLSQVVSASSCARNWSAHWHIHKKIRNRLDPATTEKLVYVYSNSKLVASTRDADKLKMFAWDNEIIGSALPACWAGWTGQARGAEAPRRRVAHFGPRREA